MSPVSAQSLTREEGTKTGPGLTHTLKEATEIVLGAILGKACACARVISTSHLDRFLFIF
jgi:N6-adenosine-specific RNA methylase IME4